MPNDIRITELPLLNRDLVDTDEFAIDDLNGNTNKVTLRGLKMAAGGETYTKTQIDELLALKENKLTFDSAPTDGSTNPVTSNGVYDALDVLENRIEDLEYEPLAINNFRCIEIVELNSSIAHSGNGITAAKGMIIARVTLAWESNKIPTTLSLDGIAITNTQLTRYELTGLALTNDTNFTLIASDSGSPNHSATTVTKVATLLFQNYVCYGVATIPASINSAFVNGLIDKHLSSTRVRTFTVNVGSGQYIWYAVPTSLGQCTFKVGGFDGGFEPAQIVSVTNSSGYTENYYVYRSTNTSLGQTTVVVS